jgi:hypothetical protein
LLRSFDGSLLHAAAAGDQVNQDAEHWDHYDEYDPQRFGETAQITTAENIAKDDDQQPDPGKEKEKLQHRPENVQQRITIGKHGPMTPRS